MPTNVGARSDFAYHYVRAVEEHDRRFRRRHRDVASCHGQPGLLDSEPLMHPTVIAQSASAVISTGSNAAGMTAYPRRSRWSRRSWRAAVSRGNNIAPLLGSCTRTPVACARAAPGNSEPGLGRKIGWQSHRTCDVWMPADMSWEMPSLGGLTCSKLLARLILPIGQDPCILPHPARDAGARCR